MPRRVLILILLCLSISCSRKQTIGSPYILYEIHGTVLAPDGMPVEGIVVSTDGAENVLTTKKGNFVIYGRSVPSRYASLSFTDIDKGKNGGYFMKSSVSVELKLRSAGEGNNQGNYFASGVTVTLVLQNEEIQGDKDPLQ